MVMFKARFQPMVDKPRASDKPQASVKPQASARRQASDKPRAQQQQQQQPQPIPTMPGQELPKAPPIEKERGPQ